MIVDKIENLSRYPQFAGISFDIRSFLEYMKEQNLGEGKYKLQGEALYAIVQKYQTIEKDKGRMESHKKYADLQYIYQGEEMIFYDSADELEIEEDHRPQYDIVFYKRKADKGGVRLSEGMFGYFEPQDAHMPCIRSAQTGAVTKIVFKILL